MPNPNYAELFEQIRLETNPVIREQLIEQAYQFNEPLTPEEAQFFDYLIPGYVQNNPGGVGNSFRSYVGVYINQEGEYTGNYP